MLVQAAALGLLVVGDDPFTPSLVRRSAARCRYGDGLPDSDRGRIGCERAARPGPLVGVYRFWRDFSFVLGALIAGIGADVASPQAAIALVAVLTAGSGLVVAATSWQPRRAPTRPFPDEGRP